MSPLNLVLGGLGAMIVGAVASAVLRRFGVLFHVVGCLLALLGAAAVLVSGREESLALAWELPLGRLSLRLDALSAFFLMPSLVVSMLASIYGSEYLRPYPRGATTWLFFNLTVVALVLVLLASNGVLFLMAWEVMSVASFLLVVFEDDKPPVRRAGLTYLTATHLGTLVLFVLFLSGTDSDLGFPRVAAAGLLPLALVGFGVKAGFIPLHTWLPEAHPAAPSHVSALLSGVILKTGVYGILRVESWVGTPPGWWGELLVLVGVTSGVLGVVMALAQHHLKRLLAYHSVENLGIIAIGLGLGALGVTSGDPGLAATGMAGGLLHVWNHAVFKSLLFLGAGAVGQATHCLKLDELGGLGRTMPRTALSFLVGSAAISGVPPLNGFVSEFLIFCASLQALQSENAAVATSGAIAMAGLALISGLALACFAKAHGAVFLGEPRGHCAPGRDPGPAMLAPMLTLAALCLSGGLAAPLLTHVLIHPVALLAGLSPDQVTQALPVAGLVAVALMSLTVMGGVGALELLSRRARSLETGVTWDCGYLQPTPRMQYTAESFAQPLVDLFRSVLLPRRRGQPVEGLFPAEASFTEASSDVFEEFLVRPPLTLLGRLARGVRWFQHGRIQLYLLYIVVTLVLLIGLEVL